MAAYQHPLLTQRQLKNFWAKVQKSTDCWLWSAATNDAGYGFFRVGKRQRYAHIVSFALRKGRWPRKGLYVIHRCDTPCCVRPTHLREATPRMNQQDMLKKHRQRRASGADHGSAKLTWKDVSSIRSALRAGASGKALSTRFGISRSAISNINRGKTWKALREAA